MAIKSITDLRAATYNPREITTTQLKQLRDSIETFGDLSGIVVNVAKGKNTLVSGHQRLKTLKGKKTRIVKTECKKDQHGTVATGWIEVLNGKTVTKIPYREVDWLDKQMEMAANVNANSAGGEFDKVKLGSVLAKLQAGKFKIESLALDKFSMMKAMIDFRKSNVQSKEEVVNTKSKDSKKTSFDKVDPRSEKFEHVCPRCKFKWS
jgi:hypothetical protein